MKDEHVPLFVAELAALCARYDVAGVSGVWFSGDSADNYGFLKPTVPCAPDVVLVGNFITDKLESWMDDFHKGPETGTVYAVGRSNRKK